MPTYRQWIDESVLFDGLCQDFYGFVVYLFPWLVGVGLDESHGHEFYPESR